MNVQSPGGGLCVAPGSTVVDCLFTNNLTCADVPRQNSSGYQGWCTSMIIVPEDEAAALQCMTAMMDFATGFELYCKCQHGLRGSVPSLQGVAMTVLSGQVLNHAKTHPRLVDLPTLEAAALVFDRPSEPERYVLAAFADKPMRLTFRVPPHARFKTMDLYGNFGRTAADGHGVLTLDLKAMAFHGTVDNMARVEDWGRYELAPPQ